MGLGVGGALSSRALLSAMHTDIAPILILSAPAGDEEFQEASQWGVVLGGRRREARARPLAVLARPLGAMAPLLFGRFLPFVNLDDGPRCRSSSMTMISSPTPPALEPQPMLGPKNQM